MQRRMFVVLFLAAALLASGCASRGAASDSIPSGRWKIEVPEREVAPDSGVSQTVWSVARPPFGEHDRIRLHRYRVAGKSFASVLYLPGTHMNGEAAPRDQNHNPWLYLAAHGVEVYALDYRTHAIAPEASPASLAASRGWDTQAFLGDIEVAARAVRRESGRKELFVAGFSRGAFLAYAHALAQPRDLAGLAILDGSFKSQTPTGRYDAAGQLRALEVSGNWASDVGGSRGWQWRQELMRTVAADPSVPSSDPAHASAGDLLAHVLQTAWGPGGLANPQGGASKPQVLAALLVGYDRYYPAIQNIESSSIADFADDPTTAIDDAWGTIHAPVLAFASTGLGERWTQDVLHSARASGSTQVETHVLEGYGHLDVLVGEAAPERVYGPLLDWLRTHAKDDSRSP